MSSSPDLFDLPESVKYDIDLMDTFNLSEDAVSKSYQYFVDENMKLQQDNHRYGILVSQLQQQCNHWQLKCKSQQTQILQLQQDLSVQRTNFDNKFNQFLNCANDYDKQKQSEIQQLKQERMAMNKRFDSLKAEFMKLHEKYQMIQDGTKYKTSKWSQVYEWIINTINDQRLNKYDKILHDNLKREAITNQVLQSLNDDDLYYLGIKNYFDRELLCESIQKLINSHFHHQQITSNTNIINIAGQTPASSVTCIGSNSSSTSTSTGLGGSPRYLSPKTIDNNNNNGMNDDKYKQQKTFSVDQLKKIRIRQKNIVYIVGLPVALCNAKLLKSGKWFGKFGNISRICFNTSPKCVKANSIPTFVTYNNEYDAFQAIQKMNLFCLADGTRLKTNYGRTKYCPAFCEGQQCINGKCKFLHQWAKVDDIITEQEINDFNAIRAGPPSRINNKQ